MTSPYRETCAGCDTLETINRKLHEDCKTACEQVTRLREEMRTTKRRDFFWPTVFLMMAILLGAAVFGGCRGYMSRPHEPEPVVAPEPCKDSAQVFSAGIATCAHPDAIIITEKLSEEKVLARCTCPRVEPPKPETP